jgi:hypothetical protein
MDITIGIWNSKFLIMLLSISGWFCFQFYCRYNFRFETKDIAPEVLKKPVCRIWLKIGIFVDLEVPNKVSMDLKALAPLFDPTLGHYTNVNAKR